ncbi:hypothetical protein [uncultured Nonlabens sp.]|uniref:hypothetical protein n=1 Tax=uncultured Nonlabens sp. TaxID=859306 RepID=UPI00262033D8|nr:hypothetical protein [uncultured Nonlabens sp.]
MTLFFKIIIAYLVMRQLDLNKRNTESLDKTRLLKENNEMLRNFAHVVSHDMKTPLANMIRTSDVIS